MTKAILAISFSFVCGQFSWASSAPSSYSGKPSTGHALQKTKTLKEIIDANQVAGGACCNSIGLPKGCWPCGHEVKTQSVILAGGICCDPGCTPPPCSDEKN